MDHVYDIPDSTDWLITKLPTFAPVEAAMRCQVCKDFFDTPMMTSCCHTFCSICIRRCLTSDGKCPTCRAEEQELRLRRNWAVQELVDSFQVARLSLLDLAKKVTLEDADIGERGLKRKLSDIELEAQQGSARPPTRKVTRSHSRRLLHAQDSRNTPIDLEGDDSDYKPGLDERSSTAPQADSSWTDDGFAACPICEQRMKEEDVYLHLDVCKGGFTHGFAKSLGHLPRKRSPPLRDPCPVASLKPLDRLPKLNYSLLKENALRKKFGELGIPSWGSRSLMIRRHTEWVNLWNANCDSSRPRSKRELLQELDSWERSQGGHAPNQGGALGGGNSVMRKDFDGAGWASNHDVDFKQLISSARATRGALNGAKHATPGELRTSLDASDVSLGTDQLPSSGQKPHGPERRDVSDQALNSPRNPIYEQYPSHSTTGDDGYSMLASDKQATPLPGLITDSYIQSLTG